jgi:flagellar biosynthesis protein FlhF
MEIHKYTGRDSRSAMAQVRAALGADALILANRRVGGLVEITATRDVAGTLQQPAAATAASVAAPAPQNELQMQALQRELSRLRGMLEQELGRANWRDSARRPGPQAMTLQRLRRLGLSRGLAGSIVDALRGEDGQGLWEAALVALARRLATPRALPEQTAVAVLGSTGVGKTSTLARLAARDVQRLGRDAVGLITLDSYRIGAQEQLATFADALSLPLLPADDARGLRSALQQLRGRPRIYIDTAGMSQFDRRLLRQLALLDDLPLSLQRMLVLSAVSQPSQGRALLQSLGAEAFSGAIISKVDEATTLGGVLDVVVQAGLPVPFVTDGQRIPEDLSPVTPAQLVARAVDLLEREQARVGASRESLRAAV